jgi:hypothetical protein
LAITGRAEIDRAVAKKKCEQVSVPSPFYSKELGKQFGGYKPSDKRNCATEKVHQKSPPTLSEDIS